MKAIQRTLPIHKAENKALAQGRGSIIAVKLLNEEVNKSNSTVI